ncbi:MAG: pentapeptide repeat-containing protein [Deltaproteobacteria bacterium]|nr:MAG: pentapeptide repeat-containing protein [Deltaproteobacteria bacterium]
MGTDLNGAQLHRAILINAIFGSEDLCGARLSGACLHKIIFRAHQEGEGDNH